MTDPDAFDLDWWPLCDVIERHLGKTKGKAEAAASPEAAFRLRRTGGVQQARTTHLWLLIEFVIVRHVMSTLWGFSRTEPYTPWRNSTAS